MSCIVDIIADHLLKISELMMVHKNIITPQANRPVMGSLVLMLILPFMDRIY